MAPFRAAPAELWISTLLEGIDVDRIPLVNPFHRAGEYAEILACCAICDASVSWPELLVRYT
jgi:hypothetical protein